MSHKNDIIEFNRNLLNDDFNIIHSDKAPAIDDPRLTFGTSGIMFYTAVLYIDIRKSTQILNQHKPTTVAKIHTAYYNTIVKISSIHNGEVRSFNGDSLLVFFTGTKNRSCDNAVKAAMEIVEMLAKSDNSINKILINKRYSPINFGIGVDYGEILCTKVGRKGQYNQDLIWIGNSVNRAVRISDKGSDPNYIGISDIVHDNLSFNLKHYYLNSLQKLPLLIWKKETYFYATAPNQLPFSQTYFTTTKYKWLNTT